ncbi:MAG: PLDc N-terminal domain-containing protein [Bacilli bacterium]|nr:PLDc N-terminal domain-containing protein [Bacilli bacterium]
MIIPFLIGLAVLVLYVYLIVKIIQDPSINDNSKIFWVVLLLIGNIVGLIIYLVVQDKNILSNHK